MQARAVQTRAALFAAAKVEFSTRGYEATTALSIAKRARTAAGSFYQYFPDKDAVLREIASERLGEVSAAIDPLELAETAAFESGWEGAALLEAARSQFDAIVRGVTALHRDDPGLHAVLTQRRHCDPDLDALTSRAESALVNRFATLLDRLEHPADSEALAFVLFGMVEGSVHAHVMGEPIVSDERLFSTLVNALLSLALPNGEVRGAVKSGRTRSRPAASMVPPESRIESNGRRLVAGRKR